MSYIQNQDPELYEALLGEESKFVKSDSLLMGLFSLIVTILKFLGKNSESIVCAEVKYPPPLNRKSKRRPLAPDFFISLIAEWNSDGVFSPKELI